MAPRRRNLPPTLALFAVAALVAACSSTPPPEPPKPEPVAEPEPAPPPKPKKKPCKALDEECAAKESTKAKIAGSEAMIFTPAKGWIYAQGESVTVAQSGEDGPVIAIAEVDIEEGKKEAESRDKALEAIAKEVNVTLPKKKVSWKKPDEPGSGAVKTDLWQMEGAARGEKKGPLLVFTTALEDKKRAVIGIGFVPSDDSSGADASIIEAIKTIGPK